MFVRCQRIIAIYLKFRALVLQGGGTLGAYEAGVLKILLILDIVFV
jgi:predicted acylesterase/phospholipase RssA